MDEQPYGNAFGENIYLEVLQHMCDSHSIAQSPFQDITCLSRASEDLVRVLKLVCVVSSLFSYTECVYNPWF